MAVTLRLVAQGSYSTLEFIENNVFGVKVLKVNRGRYLNWKLTWPNGWSENWVNATINSRHDDC